MRQIFSPEPIGVDVPHNGEEGSNHDVQMTSELFRQGCFLPEALALAAERAGEPSDMTVISAGCSIGAEADSVLALHRRAGYEGNVTIKGYDINRLAVSTATRGLHKVYAPNSAVQVQQRCVLKHMGFETLNSRGDNISGLFMDADAAPVRDGHDVEFAEHDLLEPFSESEPADLVLANNVLYYFSPGEAKQVVRHLCETLTDNGVIGFGSATLNGHKWRKMISGVMSDEFGLRPIFGGDGPVLHRGSVPVLFGRE